MTNSSSSARYLRGRHRSNIAALAYIAAFAAGKDESVNNLIADPPPGAADPGARQRAMSERASATEAPGSHEIYVSNQQMVDDLIKQVAGHR